MNRIRGAVGPLDWAVWPRLTASGGLETSKHPPEGRSKSLVSGARALRPVLRRHKLYSK